MRAAEEAPWLAVASVAALRAAESSTAITGVIAAEPCPSGTIPTGTMTITAIMDVNRSTAMAVSDGGVTHQPNNRPSLPIIASKCAAHYCLGPSCSWLVHLAAAGRAWTKLACDWLGSQSETSHYLLKAKELRKSSVRMAAILSFIAWTPVASKESVECCVG